MATLEALKHNLRRKVAEKSLAPTQKLSDKQYSEGFNLVVQNPGWTTYEEFIIPQLSFLLDKLSRTRHQFSVLEIGPGPKSVVGYLPDSTKRKIKRYDAFEPNSLFATELEEWLCSTSDTPLPNLEDQPQIQRVPFSLDNTVLGDGNDGVNHGDGSFDLILFCHSMYGMKSKRKVIEQALQMLSKKPGDAMVVVFHRDGILSLDGLVCHRTACFPTGIIQMSDDDETLDMFAPFISGFIMQDNDLDKIVRVEWRKVCRALGHREKAHPGQLLFSSPNVMMAFTRDGTALPELTAQVPLADKDIPTKSWEARLHEPASIIKPTEIRQVQQCVKWALKHGVSLAIIGGSHSGNCRKDNTVSIDMGAFNQVDAVTIKDTNLITNSGSFVVAGAGCKTGDIIRKAMTAGVTVPLGSRPSVGAGMWLQGGIGHLSRLHGLTCDAIVGAVMISVASGRVLCMGFVPDQHQPAGAVRPENESDLLWAMKGAGTNLGIMISVTFKAQVAPSYSIRDWVIPLSSKVEGQQRLSEFGEFVTEEMPRHGSADAYLYWDTGNVHFGVSMCECSTTGLADDTLPAEPTVVRLSTMLRSEASYKVVDGIGLFDTEMYMSGMHGGHGGGKTSSFKRCVFLKGIGRMDISDILVTAIETRPSPLCYLHLLQGGGAIADPEADASAFGCRDWDFACVITGVWPRDQDRAEVAQDVVRWVYKIAADLLPLSAGAYSADLGPDPRDAALAANAFGPNLPRLAGLKHSFDPNSLLAYTCPLPAARTKPKLIVLVTGEPCAGKDYCADAWVSVFTTGNQRSLAARSVRISDLAKREYATTTGADFDRLIRDRVYKEQHRPALTAFFQDQMRQRPWLPEQHFLDLVSEAVDVDVLFITGMREEAPVAVLSHLVPESRLIDVQIRACEETRRIRQGRCGSNDQCDMFEDRRVCKDSSNGGLSPTALDYRPSFVFVNDADGNVEAKGFAEDHLLRFFHEHLLRLNSMVHSVPGFPRRGIDFRHVLDVSQQPGGLALSVSLLQSHFANGWAKTDAVACCEAGGFIFASALAARVGVPLLLIREAGKLPPPTVSVAKPVSHISSPTSTVSREQRIEMGRNVVRRGASVVVIDDVLATGKTLCAVLQLLILAGIRSENVAVMVVAEFPLHRGRELLHRRGLGRVRIQSLLVFGGA